MPGRIFIDTVFLFMYIIEMFMCSAIIFFYIAFFNIILIQKKRIINLKLMKCSSFLQLRAPLCFCSIEDARKWFMTQVSFIACWETFISCFTTWELFIDWFFYAEPIFTFGLLWVFFTRKIITTKWRLSK